MICDRRTCDQPAAFRVQMRFRESTTDERLCRKHEALLEEAVKVRQTCPASEYVRTHCRNRREVAGE